MTKVTDYLDALSTLNKIDEDKSKYLIIHYACESFYGEDITSKKITSIAVRKLSDAQTELFSIVRAAEEKGIDLKEIQMNYERIEKYMLDQFFDFVERNNTKNWIHWNMRDALFGFKAIEHRYRVLGGKPIKIPDNSKIDLSRLLINRYGKGFINHPRMEKLMEKNMISNQDFLTGKQEAKAYDNSEFNKLSRSTSKKVDIFENILRLTIHEDLNTLSTKKEVFGNSIQGYWYRINSTWIGKYFIHFIDLIIGGFIGFWISQFLG